MRTFSINWNTIADAGSLWQEYFELRHKVFHDGKGWSVGSAGGLEFDCYDTPHARWIIVEDEGHCVGGARVIRCDARQFGPYSYMIADFKDGVLQGAEPETMPEVCPRSTDYCEATRFFTSPDLDKSKAIEAYRQIVTEVCDAGEDMGCHTVMALMPRRIYSIFRRLGFDVVENEASEVIDGRPHSVGFLSISGRPHQLAAE